MMVACPRETAWCLPRGVWLFAALAVCLSGTGAIHAQSLQERVEYMKAKRARQAQVQQQAARPTGPSIDQLLGQRMDFNVADVGFKEAMDIWSERTGVRMLINWRQMENDGVDPDVPITLQLQQLPAARVLLILLDVGSTEFRFIAEVEPWGMQVRTREQANRDVHVKVYDVRDLVMEIPHFTDAPSFELSEVLQSDAGGGAGIFDDQQDNDREELTLQERGDELAETIRQTVEPDVWRGNGGEFSAITFTNGKLIIRAPLYVHGQIAGSALIGAPDTPTGFNFRTRNGGMRSVPRPQANAPGTTGNNGPAIPKSNGVGGVAPNPQSVGGVAE